MLASRMFQDAFFWMRLGARRNGGPLDSAASDAAKVFRTSRVAPCPELSNPGTSMVHNVAE